MASSLYRCSEMGGHRFCLECWPQQSSCIMCTLCGSLFEIKIGGIHGAPVDGVATLKALSEITEPLNLSKDQGENNDPGINGMYANDTRPVTKISCKFAKSGCHKNFSCESTYEKHILKCSFRESKPTAYTPPLIDDFLEQYRLDIDEEMKLIASSDDDSSGSDWSDMDCQDADNMILDYPPDPFQLTGYGQISGKYYLLRDIDPWLWTQPERTSPDASKQLIQRELGLLHTNRKKPEYLMALSQRLVTVCEQVVNSL